MKSIQQTIINDRRALLNNSLISSLEVLKDKFGFTQEQLTQFADEYVKALQKNAKTKKKE